MESLTQVEDGEILSSVGYGYVGAGRRTSMTDSYGLHSFSYDSAGNLAMVDHPVGFPVDDEAFTYDSVGNALSSRAARWARCPLTRRTGSVVTG